MKLRIKKNQPEWGKEQVKGGKQIGMGVQDRLVHGCVSMVFFYNV
ncbi:MAG: hypothetical protein N3D85_06200 [Candidatus Bathyarchaeota archaeon]|nr:hypothetical protein [Candidatus Bathyarchaeota archaeon]